MRTKYPIPTRLRHCLLAVAGLVLLFGPHALFAQSCSLCYTQAAASTARFLQALRSGILILMIPPMLMSIGLTVLTYRRRNDFHSSR
jgi:hypothetical protein